MMKICSTNKKGDAKYTRLLIWFTLSVHMQRINMHILIMYALSQYIFFNTQHWFGIYVVNMCLFICFIGTNKIELNKDVYI